MNEATALRRDFATRNSLSPSSQPALHRTCSVADAPRVREEAPSLRLAITAQAGADGIRCGFIG